MMPPQRVPSGTVAEAPVHRRTPSVSPPWRRGQVTRASWIRAGVTLVLLSGLALPSHAQPDTTRRSRPPRWDHLPPGVFYENAFAEGLQGERPKSMSGQARTVSTNPDEHRESAASLEIDGTPWSDLISASTLEDEIKLIKRRMDDALQSEGYFKGTGHRQLRPELSTAAVLFAIIDRFDGPVRWQPDAAAARDRFARVAQNAKAASPQVYREAQQRRQDLADLIRGARLSETGGERPLDWPTVADRQLIMQRLEVGVHQRLSAGLSSAAVLREQHASMLRESELAAALARVLRQAEMPDAGDTEYDTFCEQLEQASSELRRSVQQEDTAGVRQAHGEMKKSCVACHELYRS